MGKNNRIRVVGTWRHCGGVQRYPGPAIGGAWTTGAGRDCARILGLEFWMKKRCLKRRELGRLIFEDASERTWLEALLHPHIREAWKQQASVWKAEGRNCAVADVPLLFETAAPIRI